MRIFGSLINVRIVSLLLLLPMFAGIGEAWTVLNKIVYPLILMISFLVIMYKGKVPKLFSRDNLFALLILYATLVIVMDYQHGTFSTFEGFHTSKSWEVLVTVLVSFLIIAMRVSEYEFLFSVIVGLVMFYVYRMLGLLGVGSIEGSWDLILSKTAYSNVVILTALLLYLKGKRVFSILLVVLVLFQSLRANLLAYGITIAIYHIHTYLYPKKLRSYNFARFMVATVLLGLLVAQIGVAFNMFSSTDWETITTGRSLWYSIILGKWLLGGTDIFFPAYPGCSSDILSAYTLYDKQFAVIQCPHSIIIEMMVDYGIIIGLLFIFLMVPMSKRNGIFATCFFLVVASFQCENFSAFYFTPYLLVYRYLVPGSGQVKTKLLDLLKPGTKGVEVRLPT